MEGDGPGSVFILNGLGFDLSVLAEDVIGLDAVGVFDGQGLRIKFTGHDPSGALCGTAGPVNGDPGAIAAGGLHHGAGSAPGIGSYEIHDGILAVLLCCSCLR